MSEIARPFVVDQSRIMLEQSSRINHGKRDYRINATVLTGVPQTRIDPYKRETSLVTPDAQAQYSFHVDHPVGLRGVLTSFTQGRDDAEDSMSFVLTTLPDHDGLFAQMFESGYPMDLIVKSAASGIIIPLRKPQVRVKAFLRTQHDGIRPGNHKYNTQIPNRYCTEVGPQVVNYAVKEGLFARVKELAEAAHQVLPAIAQQITRDAIVSDTMVCSAFDTTMDEFITL